MSVTGSMFNDFISEILLRIKEKHIREIPYDLVIRGYIDLDLINTKRPWNISVQSLSKLFKNKFDLNGITTITNKLPTEYVRLYYFNDHTGPYIFIPEGKLKFLKLELIDPTYEPPYTEKQMLENGYKPELVKKLMNDKVHYWRAITGIELIHKEPTDDEQYRIWDNWNKMGVYSKQMSDNRSIEIFNMTNEEHFEQITKNKFWKPNPIFSKKDIQKRKAHLSWMFDSVQ